MLNLPSLQSRTLPLPRLWNGSLLAISSPPVLLLLVPNLSLIVVDIFFRRVRIFVSSTFSDMKAERTILNNSVFPQIKHLCEKRGIDFSFVDLQWGITETMAKDGEGTRTPHLLPHSPWSHFWVHSCTEPSSLTHRFW